MGINYKTPHEVVLSSWLFNGGDDF